jgi:hypothetical protein
VVHPFKARVSLFNLPFLSPYISLSPSLSHSLSLSTTDPRSKSLPQAFITHSLTSMSSLSHCLYRTNHSPLSSLPTYLSSLLHSLACASSINLSYNPILFHSQLPTLLRSLAHHLFLSPSYVPILYHSHTYHSSLSIAPLIPNFSPWLSRALVPYLTHPLAYHCVPNL